MNKTYDFDNYIHISPEEPQTVSVYLKQIMENFNLDAKSPEHIIQGSWKEIVGEDLCKAVIFDSVNNNTLKVKCKNSSTASLFRLHSKEILKKINSLFPKLELSKVYVLKN